MAHEAGSPHVSLTLPQKLRFAFVGLLAAFVVARAAPDVMRVYWPVGYFGYVTDRDGKVIKVPAQARKGFDRIVLGDRVRLDLIKPFDRKPGLAGTAYTQSNYDRHLPVERNGKVRILHLQGQPESAASRAIVVLRIVLMIAAVALGGLLFLIKPSVATLGFFLFCISFDAPTTYTDTIVDVPWREIAPWFSDLIHGFGRAALLIFALCLFINSHKREVQMAFVVGALGIALGLIDAAGDWMFTYLGRSTGTLDAIFRTSSSAITAVTTVVFIAAFLRSRGEERHRIGWMCVAFAFAGIARLLSDRLYPTYLNFWEHGLLIGATVVPVIVVWIAVIRDGFFDVDFLVSRAIVYMAIGGALAGVIGASEEIATYVFYNNTDLATIITSAAAVVFTTTFGKMHQFLKGFVDRFIFKERAKQHATLERIARHMIDAETNEQVYDYLLKDAPETLHLAFSGIFRLVEDGGYELSLERNWPPECVTRLEPRDALTRAMTRKRSVLTFEGRDTALVQRAFPSERLTFAAPIFIQRTVGAIIVYGHSITGVDLDPDEREILSRIVANASIALSAIELAYYRSSAIPLMARPG